MGKTKIKKDNTHKAKIKQCQACQKDFTVYRPMQQVCGSSCALVHAKAKLADKVRRQNAKEARDFKLNDKPFRAKEAQKAFNAYIRARDADLPCISCQKFHTGQWDAGHFQSVGAHIELRFEELNVHRQCSPCNRRKGGNLIEYRIHLKDRIGEDKVEWLEGSHPIPHHTASDLFAIERKYKLKLKEVTECA